MKNIRATLFHEAYNVGGQIPILQKRLVLMQIPILHIKHKNHII